MTLKTGSGVKRTQMTLHHLHMRRNKMRRRGILSNVSRILWLEGAAVLCHAGSSLSLSVSGTSRSSILPVLRCRRGTWVSHPNCKAGHGKNNSSFSASCHASDFCSNCLSLSDPMHFARIHAVFADGVGTRVPKRRSGDHTRAV